MHYLAISNNSKKNISLPHRDLCKFPKFFSSIFAQNAQVCARVEGLFFMNYIIVFILAWNFGFLTLIPLLAQSFLRAQGLGRIQNGSVLLYCEYLNLGRIRSNHPKEPPKNKANLDIFLISSAAVDSTCLKAAL